MLHLFPKTSDFCQKVFFVVPCVLKGGSYERENKNRSRLGDENESQD